MDERENQTEPRPGEAETDHRVKLATALREMFETILANSKTEIDPDIRRILSKNRWRLYG
jgi:hypothetical protein